MYSLPWTNHYCDLTAGTSLIRASYYNFPWAFENYFMWKFAFTSLRWSWPELPRIDLTMSSSFFCCTGYVCSGHFIYRNLLLCPNIFARMVDIFSHVIVLRELKITKKRGGFLPLWEWVTSVCQKNLNTVAGLLFICSVAIL